MSKITIVEGNSNDKDNVRVIMVKGEKGEQGDLNHNDIVDNLTSTSTNKVLSAKQGKVLKNLVDTNTSNISSNAEAIDSEASTRQSADTTLQNNINDEASTRAIADATLQNQITGLASGSPLGASSVAEMTDTTRVYVLSTNGHWYYYNGTEWTDGGVYQSAIFNTQGIFTKNGINSNDGAINPRNDRAYTEYFYDFDVFKSLSLVDSSIQYMLVFYDKDKNWLSNESQFKSLANYDTTSARITNAKYFRVLIKNSDNSNFGDITNDYVDINMDNFIFKFLLDEDVEIYNYIDNKFIIKPTFSIGGLSGSDGSYNPRKDRAYTQYFYNFDIYKTLKSIDNSIQYMLVFYDKDKNWLSNQSTFINTTPYDLTQAQVTNAKYFRIVIKNTNNSNFTDITNDYIELISNNDLLSSIIKFQDDEIYIPSEFENVYDTIENLDISLYPSTIGSFNQISRLGWKGKPEQSIPSYIEAYKNGCRLMLCDVRVTSDNYLVCLHDDTINREARNSDGTVIANDVYINQITLAQAETYDFGIKYGSQYAGLKILTVEDFLILCKKLNVIPIFETKIGLSQTNCNDLIQMIKKYGFSDNFIFAESPFWLPNTYPIFNQETPNFTLLIRGFNYGSGGSEMAVAYAKQYATPEKHVILGMTDFDTMTQVIADDLIENNVDLELSEINDVNPNNALQHVFGSSVSNSIKYFVCSDTNLYKYNKNNLFN